VLLPLYSALGAVAAGGIARGATGSSPLRLAALNHLRVPVLLSGLMLLVWFPLVLERDPASFARANGLSTDVYLERWLGLTSRSASDGLVAQALDDAVGDRRPLLGAEQRQALERAPQRREHARALRADARVRRDAVALARFHGEGDVGLDLLGERH